VVPQARPHPPAPALNFPAATGSRRAKRTMTDIQFWAIERLGRITAAQLQKMSKPGGATEGEVTAEYAASRAHASEYAALHGGRSPATGTSVPPRGRPTSSPRDTHHPSHAHDGLA
jgi:hypothetical protein